jgi:enterochelin esterase-like enzyme
MNKLFVVAFLLLSLTLTAQDYSSFTQTIKKLYSGVETEQTWLSLVETNSIPFTKADSVAFLYRGNARTVNWMGDFNGWGYDKKFNSKGVRIPNTDIWILKASFPKDARLDYKIIINDVDWMIDPLNPNNQWSGVGGGSPNSELRMPSWKPDPSSIQKDGVLSGRMVKDVLFNSNSLGYQITYNVYLPVGYNTTQKYPIIYVTDGYEYLHERMGNMQTILDNLIFEKKIEPVVAVFVDHREPVNRANNRRMQELAMNNKYLKFFEDEFVFYIESKYSISTDPKRRAILGTAMGGLTAAYFAFTKPGVFGMTGIQSPAFFFKPEIYKVCDNPENPPVKVYLTTGVINDAQDGARRMKDILEKNTCNYQYSETNQGQSWGNWRDSIDDILVYFFPPK